MEKSLDAIPWKERQWGHTLARTMINTKQKPHKSKKAFRGANVHTLCISFNLSQNSLSDKQTKSTHRKARLEPAIKDAQKLAQNVFPP